MPTPPTKRSLLHLYHSMLWTSLSFSSYNFRNYFVRRTKSTFRDIQKEKDPATLTAFYSEKAKELAVLKRSAIVNQLYGGRRLVVEEQKLGRERGDT